MPKGEFVRIWRLTLGPNRRYSSLLYTLSFTPFFFDPLPYSVFNVMAGKSQLERAIKEIQVRRPAPDIDFTQHQLENGLSVSTQERVVKEVLPSPLPMHIIELMECPLLVRVA